MRVLVDSYLLLSIDVMPLIEYNRIVVFVFATAVIENSPTEVLSHSEFKNLQTLVSERTIVCQIF